MNETISIRGGVVLKVGIGPSNSHAVGPMRIAEGDKMIQSVRTKISVSSL
jgi:hypothetical protein